MMSRNIFNCRRTNLDKQLWDNPNTSTKICSLAHFLSDLEDMHLKGIIHIDKGGFDRYLNFAYLRFQFILLAFLYLMCNSIA